MVAGGIEVECDGRVETLRHWGARRLVDIRNATAVAVRGELECQLVR